MHYAEHAPREALREVVRCYWFLEGESGSADPALPDGSPELIFTLADPFIAVAPDGTERQQPGVFLVGQITRPFVVRPSGRIDLVGVRLEAGGATWLATDISALTDTFADVSKAHDGALDRLRVLLASAATPAERLATLDDHLPSLVAAGPAADWRVRDAVRAIRESHGMADVAELAAALRTSPRTLQRLFTAEVGTSPKLLARVVRFQRVFAAWRDDPTSLSRVAAECGYFDHAHLVRDFRDFAGQAPASFLPNQPEFTRFFTS